MRKSVETYIRECSVCAQRKDPVNTNKAPVQTIAAGKPFCFEAMDYMGPLPETARGNTYILVSMDHFTKWCEAVPTKNQKAFTVAPIPVNKVFSRFGPPTVLHSDQGASFESNVMHEICVSWVSRRLEQQHTSPVLMGRWSDRTGPFRTC